MGFHGDWAGARHRTLGFPGLLPETASRNGCFQKQLPREGPVKEEAQALRGGGGGRGARGPARGPGTQSLRAQGLGCWAWGLSLSSPSPWPPPIPVAGA